MAFAFQLILGVLLVLGGVTVLVTGWRGLRSTLPRNRYAGVRTPATMRDDDAFKLGNKVAAPTTLAGGAVMALVGVCLPLVHTASGIVILVALGLVGSTALIVIGGVLGNRAAVALNETTQPGPCAGCPGGGCAALLEQWSACEPAAQD